MTASHSSWVMFTITRSRRMPALFTSTCRSPKVSIAVRINRWAPSQSAALSRLATASPPIFSISSTTCCAGARSAPSPCMSPPRSLTTTLAPSCAKSSACSRPRPRPAPVMMAIRPSSAPMGSPVEDDAASDAPPRPTGQTVAARAPSEGQRDACAPVDLGTGGRVLALHGSAGCEVLHVGDEATRLQRPARLPDAHVDDVRHRPRLRPLAHVHDDLRVARRRLSRRRVRPDDVAGGHRLAEVVDTSRAEALGLEGGDGSVVALPGGVGHRYRSGAVARDQRDRGFGCVLLVGGRVGPNLDAGDDVLVVVVLRVDGETGGRRCGGGL